MNIHHRVHHLPPSQITILVLISVVCVVGLLSVRSKVATDEQRAKSRISLSRGWLQSVNDSLRDALSDPLYFVVRGIDSVESARLTRQLLRRRAILDSTQAMSRVERDKDAFQVVSLEFAMVVPIGLSLWLLWVWFGGRQKALLPQSQTSAPSDPSPYTASPGAASMGKAPSTLEKAGDRVLNLVAIGLAAYVIYGLLHKLLEVPKCYAEYADGYTNPYPESARNEPSRDSPIHGRIVGYVHDDLSECEKPESDFP